MELQEILESVPFQELLLTIKKKARSGSKEITNYLRGILQGCSDNSDENEKRRFETFKCALSIIQIPDISQSLVCDVISVLLLKVDSFHTSNLVKLADYLVDYSKTAFDFGTKWLEVFSKVLSCLYLRDSIVYQGVDMSGRDLRKDILSSLFSEDFDTSCIIQLVSALKDVDLSEDELNIVSDTLLKRLPVVELNNLPSFVYQLLLFSSKGNRQQILLHIALFFIKKDYDFQNNEENDKNSEDLIDNNDEVLYRQTEGTVILMISVSSRHDQSLSKEYCALLKKIQHKPDIVLLPFTFACALSLTKSVSGKDEIFETMRKSLLLAYELLSKQKNSNWMQEMLPKRPDILKLIKETIKCSRYGWDHVCQGLVKFGFSVIDAFGPRYILGGTAVKTELEEGCTLGSHILRDTFKNHRISRSEILDQILNRIITKSQKPVKHYIDILSQIVQSDPLFLLEILPKLVEILDFIHLVPHSNAIDILFAIAPLLRISMPLKDTLMLVLRKALFHRDIGARKVAVSGYLMILKKLTVIGRVSLSQSQTSISSQASSASVISTQVKADVYVSAGNLSSKTMCLEIMGLLKRVLMQQGVVRQLLYESLYDATLQNKALKDIVLELLLGQLEKYYDKSENTSVPLQFSLCVQEQNGSTILDEPLAHLLTVIHLILHESGDVSDDEDYDQSAQKMLEDMFQNLLRKMSTTEICDLNINTKDPDESSTDHILLNLILSCYETLMEYSLIQNKEYYNAACKDLINLYEKYNEIRKLMTSKKQKKSSKTKTNGVAHPMHVTIRFFSRIMEGLFTDGIFKHQEGLEVLRNNSSFVLLIVSACNQKLAKCAETGTTDSFSDSLNNSFSYFSSIAKVYFRVYTEGLNSDFPKQEYPTLELEKLPFSFAEGLASIITYVTTFKHKSARKFITDLCDNDSLSFAEAIKNVLKSIQQAIVKVLSDTENDISIKEIVPLLSIIKTLHNSFFEEFDDNIYKWLKQICARQTFQNLSIAKSVISLALSLAHHQSLDLAFFREIAFDIHYHMDDIDPDENISGSPKYNIITQDVARNIVSNLISNLEIIMDEIECLLNYMKANNGIQIELLAVLKDKDVSRQTMEKGISTRLSNMIFVLHELVQTSVPPDTAANYILKFVSRFYKVLSSFAKYYLLSHSKSKAVQLHSAFEKLVKLSHTKLTTYVYSFITYIQVISGGEGGTKKKTNIASTSKAMREIKTIPTLVFAIESYEKELILLSKKFNRNLVNHMKLSTARDFRINAAALTSVLEQETNEDSLSSTHSTQNGSVHEAAVNQNSSPSNEQEEANAESSIHSDSNDAPDHVSLNKSKIKETNKSLQRSRLARKKQDHDEDAKKENETVDSNKATTIGVKRKRLGVRPTSKKSK